MIGCPHGHVRRIAYNYPCDDEKLKRTDFVSPFFLFARRRPIRRAHLAKRVYCRLGNTHRQRVTD